LRLPSPPDLEKKGKKRRFFPSFDLVSENQMSDFDLGFQLAKRQTLRLKKGGFKINLEGKF
jgi:hypothetical protein